MKALARAYHAANDARSVHHAANDAPKIRPKAPPTQGAYTELSQEEINQKREELLARRRAAE